MINVFKCQWNTCWLVEWMVGGIFGGNSTVTAIELLPWRWSVELHARVVSVSHLFVRPGSCVRSWRWAIILFRCSKWTGLDSRWLCSVNNYRVGCFVVWILGFSSSLTLRLKLLSCDHNLSGVFGLEVPSRISVATGKSARRFHVCIRKKCVCLSVCFVGMSVCVFECVGLSPY